MVHAGLLIWSHAVRSIGGHGHETFTPAYSQPWWWISAMISVCLVLFAGIMSGLTLGLMSIGFMDLEVLQQSGTDAEKKQATKIMPVVRKQHQLLVTLLLCNAAAMEALPIFLDDMFNEVVAVLLSVTFVLAFGEVIPQAVCSRHGLAIGADMIWLVQILMVLCWPISYPVGKILDHLLGHNDSALFRRAQLKALVSIHGREAGKGGELTRDETTIIQGALDLTEKTALDSMTPIESTFSLDIHSKLDWEAMGKMLARGHSRVPVYEGNSRNLIGVLLVKSLLTVRAEAEIPVSAVSIRRMPRVSSDMPLYDILNEFQKGGSHMAAVTKAKTKKISSGGAVEGRKKMNHGFQENGNHGFQESGNHGFQDHEKDNHGFYDPENGNHGFQDHEKDNHEFYDSENGNHGFQDHEQDNHGFYDPENGNHGVQDHEKDNHGFYDPENGNYGLHGHENDSHRFQGHGRINQGFCVHKKLESWGKSDLEEGVEDYNDNVEKESTSVGDLAYKKGRKSMEDPYYHEKESKSVEDPHYFAANKEPNHKSKCYEEEHGEGLDYYSDGEVIGIITMEDVIEELLQEEIVDETDEYIDVHKKVRVVAAAAVQGRAGSMLIRRVGNPQLVGLSKQGQQAVNLIRQVEKGAREEQRATHGLHGDDFTLTVPLLGKWEEQDDDDDDRKDAGK